MGAITKFIQYLLQYNQRTQLTGEFISCNLKVDYDYVKDFFLPFVEYFHITPSWIDNRL